MERLCGEHSDNQRKAAGEIVSNGPEARELVASQKGTRPHPKDTIHHCKDIPFYSEHNWGNLCSVSSIGRTTNGCHEEIECGARAGVESRFSLKAGLVGLAEQLAMSFYDRLSELRI